MSSKDKHTFKDMWWQHRQAAERREILEQLGKGGDCGIEPQGMGNSGGKGEQHGAEECGGNSLCFQANKGSNLSRDKRSLLFRRSSYVNLDLSSLNLVSLNSNFFTCQVTKDSGLS